MSVGLMVTLFRRCNESRPPQPFVCMYTLFVTVQYVTMALGIKAPV